MVHRESAKKHEIFFPLKTFYGSQKQPQKIFPTLALRARDTPRRLRRLRLSHVRIIPRFSLSTLRQLRNSDMLQAACRAQRGWAVLLVLAAVTRTAQASPAYIVSLASSRALHLLASAHRLPLIFAAPVQISSRKCRDRLRSRRVWRS